MTKPKRRQTYPKDDSDKLRDANKKLRSEVRNLKKQLKIACSERDTAVEAWIKTEAFLAEITEDVPLEEMLKLRTLPKKAVRKKIKKETNPEELKEQVREKFAKWRKDNL